MNTEALETFWSKLRGTHNRPTILSGKYYTKTYMTLKDDSNVFRFADKDATYLAVRSKCEIRNNQYFIKPESLVRISCVKSIPGEDLDAKAREFLRKQNI